MIGIENMENPFEGVTPTPVVLPFINEEGKDVSRYFIQQDYVLVGEGGRVEGTGREGIAYVEDRVARGEAVFLGKVRFNPLVSTSSPDYIAGWPEAPAIKERPVLVEPFGAGAVKAGVEAIIADLPACEVIFTGPQKGRLQHLGGAFAIGFLLPGEYRLEFEAFPYMPVDTILKVTP